MKRLARIISKTKFIQIIRPSAGYNNLFTLPHKSQIRAMQSLATQQ
ncbi:MAG: hypothetical protein QNL33_19840 [Akkermansiaceae bacterium]